jgi:predicted GNAT family acetyltransferase
MGGGLRVVRLGDDQEDGLEELLLEAPEVNLFLLGALDQVRVSEVHWYGVLSGQRVVAAVFVAPGRLAVPWAPDPEQADALGVTLRRHHPPSMMVGPREACDRIWARWAPGVPVHVWFDQRLYVCRTADPTPYPADLAPLRRARMDELDQVIALSTAMEQEDLHSNAGVRDPQEYAQRIGQKIQAGNVWVIEHDGRIGFQIGVGTICPWGVQVGGTYVRPDLRGRGLGRVGMQALGRVLLQRHRLITLHVNEANTPAVRTYERSGYERDAAFRLLTLPGGWT